MEPAEGSPAGLQYSIKNTGGAQGGSRLGSDSLGGVRLENEREESHYIKQEAYDGASE